jgi:uncharacterized repeat protein (TIGR04076 family)
MSKFEIEVEKVLGHCSCGYKVGDKFYADGLNTPDKGFCGGAYMVLFPMQTALNCGARFNFEVNPKSKTKLACPDNGYIHFKITMMND